MQPLETLRQAEGRWQATYQLRGLPDGGDDSQSDAVVAPILGRTVRPHRLHMELQRR